MPVFPAPATPEPCSLPAILVQTAPKAIGDVLGIEVTWSWGNGCGPTRGTMTITSPDGRQRTIDLMTASQPLFDPVPVPPCQESDEYLYQIVAENEVGQTSEGSKTQVMFGPPCKTPTPTPTPTLSASPSVTPPVTPTPPMQASAPTVTPPPSQPPAAPSEPKPTNMGTQSSAPALPVDRLGAAAGAALAAVAVGGVVATRTDPAAKDQLGGLPGGGRTGNLAGALDGDTFQVDTTALTAPPNDPPNVSANFSLPQELSGLWAQDDMPGYFIVQQEGATLRATRGQRWVCGPGGPAPADDSTVETGPQSDLHLEGSLDGETITGALEVCWFGSDEDPYWAPAPLELSVADGGERLVGSWYDGELDLDVPLSLTRVPYQRLAVEDFGLPDTNVRYFSYRQKRAHRKDGTVVAVPEEYTLNPELDDDVQRHMGIDIVSRDEQWEVIGLEFTAPIGGVVRLAADSDWNTIALLLDTGDQLQFLHASEVSVTDGARVTAGQVLGKTGNVGTGVIHLHVQAKNSLGDYVDPDWVVARAKAAAGEEVRVGGVGGGMAGNYFSEESLNTTNQGVTSMSTSERWLANHAVTELWSDHGADAEAYTLVPQWSVFKQVRQQQGRRIAVHYFGSSLAEAGDVWVDAEDCGPIDRPKNVVEPEWPRQSQVMTEYSSAHYRPPTAPAIPTDHLAHIVAAAQLAEIDPTLLAATAARESRFEAAAWRAEPEQPAVLWSKRAGEPQVHMVNGSIGPCQIMRSTLRAYRVYSDDVAYDLATNYSVAARIISENLAAFPSDQKRAITAYNTGIGGARMGRMAAGDYVSAIIQWKKEYEGYFWDPQAAAGQAAAQTGWRVPGISAMSGAPATQATSAAPDTQNLRERLINYGRTLFGTPYVFGGKFHVKGTQKGLDCSGFVCEVLEYCGVKLGDRNYLSAEAIRQKTRTIQEHEARTGDLIFFKGTYDTPGASHIGFWIKPGQMLDTHSRSSNNAVDGVQQTDISTPYWRQHFMSIGRLPAMEAEPAPVVLTQSGIPQPPQAPRAPAVPCSFCGQKQDQARKIFAGPAGSGLAICDRCVQTFNLRMGAHGRSTSAARTQPGAAPERAESVPARAEPAPVQVESVPVRQVPGGLVAGAEPLDVTPIQARTPRHPEIDDLIGPG